MTEKANDKIAAIFEATLALISEQGLHATPMSQIAARAKIGMGTIYHYFPSKEELINALFLEYKVRLLRFITANYAPGAPVRESFKTLLRNMLAYYAENPAELNFLEQCENSPIITEDTKREGMRSAGVLSELFCRAKSENLIKDISFDILGALLSGAIIALAKLCLSGAVGLDSPELDLSLEAMWDMLKR
ncbi:transcriptional regulator, TetR family [Sporobacter termitidis DSM 10068]|uniref:Transcriptional regulator, TetR family n=1 Tax=Sporobacter termitidis DSM 10068 TaxID=1123282 RepID=A0A1M5Z8W8_9FIRM|nr:TetR/AcrR family transcriptional regulator [Sporobacter termitidis]SHI20689.1 transcriptional regulator, TetR family [Sporobacter termitidis DSM 10068]